jgi:hypothetical protein
MFAEQTETICDLYAYAPLLEQMGVHVVSTATSLRWTI